MVAEGVTVMVMKKTAVMERRDRNGCGGRKDHNKARDGESRTALVFQLIRQVYEVGREEGRKGEENE